MVEAYGTITRGCIALDKNNSLRQSVVDDRNLIFGI